LVSSSNIFGVDTLLNVVNFIGGCLSGGGGPSGSIIYKKKKAIDLKAVLIVKTSFINNDKPGAWYIKGYNKHYNYEEIKSKIEENVKNKKYTKRICYLINYSIGIHIK